VTTLADRIRAALDETERVARAATPGPWRWGDWSATFGTLEQDPYVLERAPGLGPFPALRHRDNDAEQVLYTEPGVDHDEAANRTHIALHDPERELRMVAAHRKILDLHEPSEYRIRRGGVTEVVMQCDHCASLCHSGSGLSCDSPDAPYPCETVQIVAEAYGVEA
jgi:hypothetical protein